MFTLLNKCTTINTKLYDILKNSQERYLRNLIEDHDNKLPEFYDYDKSFLHIDYSTNYPYIFFWYGIFIGYLIGKNT